MCFTDGNNDLNQVRASELEQEDGFNIYVVLISDLGESSCRVIFQC